MSMFNGQKIGVAFCSPHRKIKLENGQEITDTITVAWHRHRTALAMPTNFNFMEFHIDGMEIGEARTFAAYRCLEHSPHPEFLFFLDDDVLPQYDALTKLFFRAQCFPDYDIFAGVYCCKWQMPSDPLIYAGDGGGAFWDWAIGDLLTTEQHGISGTHMGLTLIRTRLFQRMLEAGVVNDDVPFFKTVKDEKVMVNGCLQTRSGTEDLFFYKLAKEVDVKIMVDTSVLAGHIDKNTGITWGLPPDSPPVQRAKWLNNGQAEDKIDCPSCSGTGYKTIGAECQELECGECHGKKKIKNQLGPKLAIDLGAGGVRRHWPGYQTYTTDLRADAKPDYVQDSRRLNLPDGHYDLVASSHHLEHIPRWEQELVWNEIFRICKPGGKIEHIVPNARWAAEKIMNDEEDEHVVNVLYGAQEAHGYARELNLHFFPYTPNIARALAENAGFVHVQIRDWKQDERLGYNLIITGEKPSDNQEISNGHEKKSSVPVHSGTEEIGQ